MHDIVAFGVTMNFRRNIPTDWRRRLRNTGARDHFKLDRRTVRLYFSFSPLSLFLSLSPSSFTLRQLTNS